MGPGAGERGLNRPGLPLPRVSAKIRARHNLDVITRAAEYVGSIGSDTGVFLAIADAAAAADDECPELERVLDLAVRNTRGTAVLIPLCEVICSGGTPEQMTAREAILHRLETTAVYPDAATALAERSR